MERPYLIGAGVRSDDPATFFSLAAMVREGAIDHIQLMIIPEDTTAFRSRIDEYCSTGVPVVIHAPHHGQGVNPCAPAAFETRPRGAIEEGIGHAMELSFEAADNFGAGIIVLHAGRFEDGGKETAFETFAAFLDRWYDDRLILENLPEVYGGYHLLGSTANDLQRLGGGRIRGYCLDFAHLYCTANYLGVPFTTLLDGFETMPVRLQHLSNSEKDSITDRHLPLDHPRGGLDWPRVIAWIRARPGVHTSLEFKENDASVYVRQLEVFADLWRRYPE